MTVQIVCLWGTVDYFPPLACRARCEIVLLGAAITSLSSGPIRFGVYKPSLVGLASLMFTIFIVSPDVLRPDGLGH